MSKPARNVEEQLRSIADFSSATEHIIAHGDRISALEANMSICQLLNMYATSLKCKQQK